MGLLSAVPRRSVNLPPQSLWILLRSVLSNTVQQGPAVENFYRRFGNWLGAPHVLGSASGRSAFQLALEALDLKKGAEIIFPVFTFPVMPMVAKLLGYTPVFCAVDRETFNAGPEHIEPKINADTGAVLATHLFGQPCPISDIAALAGRHQIRLMEDCAHACGVRIDGQAAGTFGDIGIFSFAEGKNMPCFGGGAIATADKAIAERAQRISEKSTQADKSALTKKAFSIWLKWLLTRPAIFSVSAYPALRFKQMLGQSLMDSAVGDELLEAFSSSNPKIERMANLQAALGLVQLARIDAFNEGARRNARILTEGLKDVPDITVPPTEGENHIYVYYPLVVEPPKRDGLRRYLLRHGVDSKITDMSDCSRLRPFQEVRNATANPPDPQEASILEICVYPNISRDNMHRIVRVIREWAGC